MGLIELRSSQLQCVAGVIEELLTLQSPAIISDWSGHCQEQLRDCCANVDEFTYESVKIPSIAALDPGEVTRLPLGRLLAVQPIDACEFVDWESLRSYVRSYAQRTNQVRLP